MYEIPVLRKPSDDQHDRDRGISRFGDVRAALFWGALAGVAVGLLLVEVFVLARLGLFFPL